MPRYVVTVREETGDLESTRVLRIDASNEREAVEKAAVDLRPPETPTDVDLMAGASLEDGLKAAELGELG